MNYLEAQKGLIAAIRANLDDDFPRLQYADWLEEYGDPDGGSSDRAHAEYIRKAVQAASTPQSPLLAMLNNQARLLFEHYVSVWEAPIRDIGGRDILWTRGMPLEVTVEGELADKYIPLADKGVPGLLLSDPLLLREFIEYSGDAKFSRLTLVDTGPDTLTMLAGCQHTKPLRHLRLLSNYEGILEVNRIPDGSNFSGLTKLVILDSSLGESDLPVLAGWSALLHVKLLSLTHCGISAEGMQALLGNAVFPNLTRLNLSSNYIGESATAAALLESTPLPPKLSHLDLSGNPLHDHGILALAANPTTSQLRSLDLSYSRITDAGAIALAESEQLSSLETLSLKSETPFAPETARAIADSTTLIDTAKYTALHSMGFPILAEEFAPQTERGGRDR